MPNLMITTLDIDAVELVFEGSKATIVFPPSFKRRPQSKSPKKSSGPSDAGRITRENPSDINPHGFIPPVFQPLVRAERDYQNIKQWAHFVCDPKTGTGQLLEIVGLYLKHFPYDASQRPDLVIDVTTTTIDLPTISTQLKGLGDINVTLRACLPNE